MCRSLAREKEFIVDLLVLTLMKSNQYQRVKDLLHKYTIIQPTNSQVFCLMAQILQNTNDPEHAKSWSEEIKKKDWII